MRATLFDVLILLPLLVARTEARELQLAIEQEADRTFKLSVLNPSPNAHTFIEFATNGVWFPAYFSSSNAIKPLVYAAPNTGGMRLFRAAHGTILANEVRESWQRSA